MATEQQEPTAQPEVQPEENGHQPKRIGVANLLGFERPPEQVAHFDPLAAIGQLSQAPAEWLGLSDIDERHLQITKGIMMMLMRCRYGFVNIDEIVWKEFAMRRSINSRGINALVDMHIADRNRVTDERSGWTRMVQRDNRPVSI